MAGQILSLIGADGAGKTTLSEHIASTAGLPTKRIYMGSNPASATHMLPTTRLWMLLKRLGGRPVEHVGPPSVDDRRGPPEGALVRGLAHGKSFVTLSLRLSEDAYRLLLAALFERRGYLVVVDRHPYADYYVERIARSDGWRRWGDRVHGWLLRRLYPRPHLTVLLDAPASVLHTRKGEGTIEDLEARRREYHEVADALDDVVVIDVRRPLDEVVATIRQVIDEHMDRPRRQRSATPARPGSKRHRRPAAEDR